MLRSEVESVGRIRLIQDFRQVQWIEVVRVLNHSKSATSFP